MLTEWEYVVYSDALSETFSFKLVMSLVKDQRGRQDMWLKLGSHRREDPCVSIVIRNYDGKNTTATLEKLEHNIACANNVDIERGQRGTAYMLFAMLLYISVYHDTIKVIHLVDMSKITCFGHLLSLSAFKILTKGKTWYQNVIPALYLSNPYIVEDMETTLVILQSPINMSFERFISRLKIPGRVANFTEWFTLEKMILLKDMFSFVELRKGVWLDFFSMLAENPEFGCFFFLHCMHEIYGMLRLLEPTGLSWEFDISSLRKELSDLVIYSLKSVKRPADFRVRMIGGQRVEKLRKWKSLGILDVVE